MHAIVRHHQGHGDGAETTAKLRRLTICGAHDRFNPIDVEHLVYDLRGEAENNRVGDHSNVAERQYNGAKRDKILVRE